LDSAALLISAKAPVDIKNKLGQTPLMLANRIQDKTILKMLTTETQQPEEHEDPQ
jgi:ankyrin repeat protein